MIEKFNRLKIFRLKDEGKTGSRSLSIFVSFCLTTTGRGFKGKTLKNWIDGVVGCKIQHSKTNLWRNQMSKKIVLFLIMYTAVVIVLAGCVSEKATRKTSVSQTRTTVHQIGKFVWFDLLSENPQEVQHFYKALFGWRFSADENLPGYVVIYKDEKPIGGMVHHDGKDPNVPESFWMVSLSIEDVDQAASAVKTLNGQVIDGPMDVKGRGRMAVVRDAEGAKLALLRSVNGDPPDVGADTGEWLWVDLFTHDAEKAKEFYSALVGYNTRTVELEGNHTYNLLRWGNRSFAGLVTLPWKDVGPNWLPYIKVDDLEGTINMAEKLGGKALLRSSNLAIIIDPSGAAFGIQMVGGERS